MSIFSRPAMLVTAAFLAGISLHAPEAKADVVFISNETDKYGGEVGGNLVGEAIALSATPFYLTSISAQLILPFDNTPVTFSVYSRNANGTLGSLLTSAIGLSYTSTGTIKLGFQTYPVGLLTATFSDYLLQANASYWLVMSVPDFPNTSWYWEYTSSTAYTKNDGVTLPSSDDTLYMYQGKTYYTPLSGGPMSLQVDGVLSVPEPGALGLLGAGLAGLGFARRRRTCEFPCPLSA